MKVRPKLICINQLRAFCFDKAKGGCIISEKIFDDRKELETAWDDEKRHNDLFLRIINSFDQLCENKEQKIG